MGSGAAITWLLGGQFGKISHCINNMIRDVSGIICDGAGACSMKVSTSTSAAVKSSLMAINNLRVPQSEGIVSDDVDQTIANLGRLSREDAGYRHQIINIMRAKQQGKHQ
jgi:L-cysteine desulfidase